MSTPPELKGDNALPPQVGRNGSFLGRFRAENTLIRARAWWLNKIPLSVTLMLLLLDGRPAGLGALLAFVALVLTVCAVGNYGYALNELYDIEEDQRAGRTNAAAVLGVRRVVVIIVASAAVAELFSWVTAGLPGAALTFFGLALPLVYSRPPWRIKERKWLGIIADALAAHVYPATLALLAVIFWQLRPLPPLLVVGLIAWSAAAGLRGILSHQLHTAERDRQGGLTTIVHDHGTLGIERLVKFGLLPIEVAGFVAAAAVCNVSWIFWTMSSVYLCYETFKALSGAFVATALRPQGQPYIPFVEENFYKAWGPVVIGLDAARIDPSYLLMLPIYWVGFRPHLLGEANRLRAVGRAVSGFRRPAS